MDHSGSNRYELLFMDDDAGTPTLATLPTVNKKKQATNTLSQSVTANVANKKSPTLAGNKKSPITAEKENKSSNVVNKNTIAKTLNVSNDVSSAASGTFNGNLKQGGGGGSKSNANALSISDLSLIHI